MKDTIFPLVILILMSATCTTQRSNSFDRYTIPAPTIGSDAIISNEFIYSPSNKPTPECHASSIVEISSGLIATWFGGTHENHPDVGIWISKNEGNGWVQPIEVANGVQNDTLRYPCWNPVLFMTSNGQLQLFYKVGPSPREWWGMHMTSGDEGVTWSAPSKLGAGPGGDLIGPVKNKPVQLEDGTIISPSSRETMMENGDLIWNVHFELSNDQGESWNTIGPIHDGKRIQAIQPSILIHEDGKLQILCRTRQQLIAESWSSDGGNSWTEMTLTTLPNPNAGTDAITLFDGRHLLIHNHTIRDSDFPKGREMLNLALSNDGQEWEVVMTLEMERDMEFSYPAIIQTSDGMVHTSYTYDRKTIKHVKLDPSRL